MRNLWIIIVGALCFAGLGSDCLAQETDGTGPEVHRPTVSPDGKKILFESNASLTVDIWIANRDGSAARPLIAWAGSDESDADWAPDGKRIAFASTKAGQSNIWTVAADGTDARQLTINTGSNVHPRFAPAGASLLFVSNRTGKDEIWLMDITGSNQHPVALIPLRINDPTWSPNGLNIAYSGCTITTTPACNIYIVAPDGSSFSRLTSGVFLDWEPDWTSSGVIVFASNRGNNGFGLWTVRSDGSFLQQIADQGFEPRDDHDGAIVFTRTSDNADKSLADVWSHPLSPGEQGSQITRIAGTFSGGDINGDGIVNCADVAIVRASMGKTRGQTGFDSRADVDASGTVDIRDLAYASQRLPVATVCQ